VKKKLLSITLIITMLISSLFILAGCGEAKDEDNKKSSNKNSRENTKQEKNENEEENVKEVGTSGYFVKYKDNIYYWKMNPNSRVDSALYGNLYDTVSEKNELIKVDKNGKEEKLLEDNGNGKIFVANDKIFINYATKDYNQGKKIYSVDLNGENKEEYATGEMKYLVDDYIYCEDELSNGKIFSLNTKTGEIKNLVQGYNIVGCIDDTIFYEEQGAMKKIDIGSISDNKDNGVITTFDASIFEMYDSQMLETTNIWKENGKVNIYVGYRDGSAALIQEICKITMDIDGNNAEQNIDNEASYNSTEENKEYGAVFMKYKQGATPDEYTYKLAYNDAETGKLNEVVDLDKISSEYKFTDDDEHIVEFYGGSIIDDEIYAIFDYDEHDASGDIGWRYAYKRLKTVCFKYNIKTGKFTTIYEF